VHASDRKHSSISSVAGFLYAWTNSSGDAFIRSSQRTDRGALLSLCCLDPSVATSEVIKEAAGAVMFSGTLRPTAMFRDILGFPEDSAMMELPNPFPRTNRLCIIQQGVTTRYSQRSSEQYSRIAEECTKTLDAVPGRCAVFFPSYAVLESIGAIVEQKCKKTVLREAPGISRDERQELLKKLVSYENAVLFGVASGSFGEGIDLPGVLKAVIVVGVPLEKPTLETEQRIAYYDRRFGKGWDYGYLLPALIRTLQNAGRAIRSEHDKAALVFMDERYAWPAYRKCFPDDWQLLVAKNPVPAIGKFFMINNFRNQ
jgi:DNA excision repair protein ERCC-2